MPSNPKGYYPIGSRTKFALTVEQQRKLIEQAEGKDRALLILMLSTGMHPKVLSRKDYGFTWTPDYYSWKRPKTRRTVTGVWSRAVRQEKVTNWLVPRKLLYKDVSTYRKRLGALMPGLCPLQLRHTYFVNRARLGHNAFDIAHGAATSLRTVKPTTQSAWARQGASATRTERSWNGS